ncbi:fluoride efflux transporter CrcB [Alicyclobacillus cycloheptanicus]|uniref:Fluoride-specific ion channel FluC n=1 Tax=Alicyclobacillus cycloheptanicus TaxID=1457 RepID=A0ABT9XLB4_9BACL|nr:fluoride efflux transporter CrcB [Alicyclobacillus cycloheptanicus]MDQ0190516.1 CrcB protein [Alicyclobacillus cycloheptanicus]WDM00722.1 fluoride efflux transporter CrcB [Alicyclobacillus cycloheptanicus]
MAYLAVAIGGFIGACLRFVISEMIGTVHGFPLATLCINVTGSFFLAWFYTITLERIPIHPHLRLGVGTGLVGAFTTFSTLTVDTWKLVEAGMYTDAALYVTLSFVLGLAAAGFGYALAARQSRLRFQPDFRKEG